MESARSPAAFDYACVFVLGPGNQAKIDWNSFIVSLTASPH